MINRFFRRIVPVALVLSAMACTSAYADAAKRFYLAGYMGLNVFPAQEFTDSVSGTNGEIGISNGYNFAGAIGFKLTPQLRLEGELSSMTADFDAIDLSGIGTFGLGGDLGSKLAMANIYYDFDLNWKKLQPFIGAGVGYGWHDGTINDLSGFSSDISESASGFAWQVGGGLKYNVADDMALIGAYRYLDGQDLEFGGYDINFGTHEIRFGLSWDLPFE